MAAAEPQRQPEEAQEAEEAEEAEEAGGAPGGCSDRLASAAERRLLGELRRELRAELEAAPAFPELVGDRRLLRTLRACRREVPEAAAAFRAHLEKRREFALDTVRGHIVRAWGAQPTALPLHELPGGEQVAAYVPQLMPFAHTPKGDPISVQLWGLWRTGEFVREVEDWKGIFRTHACYQLEARALLIDALSQEQGRMVHIVNVNDLNDWSMMSHLDSTFLAFQREEMLPLAATYQNLSSHVFFINTSRWFHIPYNVFFPLLPRHTQEKITLLGEDFGDAPKLLEELGAEVAAALASPAAAAAARLAAAAGAPAAAAEAEGGSRRAYFGLAVARGGAEVELQSWLHSAVIEPLASRQVLSEFRVLWAASLSAASASTLLVFELSAPQPWLSLGAEDPEILRWRRCLEHAGVRLLGPKQTVAEVTRQAHAAGATAPAPAARRAWDLGPWLSALEAFGAEVLVSLAMSLLLLWALRGAEPPGAA